MTKEQFACWLQENITATRPSDGEWNYSDLWREFEMYDKLPVHYVMDFSEQMIFFKCSDGLLVSHFERGAELETIWWFQDGHVSSNLFPATNNDVLASAKSAKQVLNCLEGFYMLTGGA